MPKVTDAYRADKRNFILACTGEILQEKPLYLVTMRDIIQKTGFSQGAVYRYYGGLDAIYVDFINRHTPPYPLEQKIDALTASQGAEKTVLADCLTTMGKYMETVLRSVVGKPLFELMVLYAYDTQKSAAILPQLQFKRSMEYARQKIMDYALCNVEKGALRPGIPIRSILLFVSSFVDGIYQSVALNTQGGEGLAAASDISEMFQTLAKAVVGFLEESVETGGETPRDRT